MVNINNRERNTCEKINWTVCVLCMYSIGLCVHYWVLCMHYIECTMLGVVCVCNILSKYCMCIILSVHYIGYSVYNILAVYYIGCIVYILYWLCTILGV